MNQREIKFRAWDKKNKKMIYCINHFVNLGGEIKAIGGNNKGEWSAPIMNYELLQFTGLKDKNGVEIYEGDIVQVEGAIPAEIYWEYSAWQLKNGEQTGGMLGNWESEQIEVIGNIYENPELLKK